MKFFILVGIAIALLGAGWFETTVLRRHNALRRTQVAELRRQSERPARGVGAARSMAAETRIPSEATNVSASAPAIEAAKIRAEIGALEKRAEEYYALHPEATDAPESNRDPEKGMTRLEYFQNAGQGTPAAAFQTLVWAALKGEDKIMAQTIGLDEAARRQVFGLMSASLSEAEREKYPTPESVMALFLAKALVRVSSLQIMATEPKDSLNAMISVRGLMGNDQKLPMRLGATGWQLVENEKNVEWLRAEFQSGGKH